MLKMINLVLEAKFIWHFNSDGHSGAVHQRRYFFSAGSDSAAAFFVTSEKGQRRCFFRQKSGSAQRCFLSKFSAAAATANKLLPRLFSI